VLDGEPDSPCEDWHTPSIQGIGSLPWKTERVAKTVTIRDIDDDLYAALDTRAAAQGMTVKEYIRQELPRLAERPVVVEWIDRLTAPAPAKKTPDVNDVLDAFQK